MADEPRVAVLIDADNVSPRLAPALIAETATHGVLGIKRIYGDWTLPALNGWRETLAEHALQPVQQFAYTIGKNATDFALVIDAMDLLYAGQVDVFCIVAHDSDYTRLAVRLRESGKRVYGLGNKSASQAFQNACDRYTFLSVLEQDEIATEVPEDVAVDVRRGITARPATTAGPRSRVSVDAWSPMTHLRLPQPRFQEVEPLRAGGARCGDRCPHVREGLEDLPQRRDPEVLRLVPVEFHLTERRTPQRVCRGVESVDRAPTRHEPVRSIERAQLVECHVPDEAGAVRRLVDGAVVDDHEMAVRGRLDVELEHVRAEGDGLLEGVHRVHGELVLAAGVRHVHDAAVEPRVRRGLAGPVLLGLAAVVGAGISGTGRAGRGGECGREREDARAGEGEDATHGSQRIEPRSPAPDPGG